MIPNDCAAAGEPKVDHDNPYTIKDGDDVWIRLRSMRRGYVIDPVLGKDHPVRYGTGSMGATLNDKWEPVIADLHLGETRDVKDPKTGKLDWIEQVLVWYPRSTIRIGDHVPLAGAVFRITNLTGNENDCRIYAKMVLEKDLPPGVSWPRERHAIPLGGKMIVWDRVELKIDDIAGPVAAAKGAERSEATARITVEHSVRTGPRTWMRKILPPQTVRTGDSIALPIPEDINTDGREPVKYYVRGIVPPDKEHHVVGWILLESQKHRHGTPEP